MKQSFFYFQDDNSLSFTEVYSSFYVDLVNFARQKTGDIHIAEDLVHELFADLYLKEQTIRNVKSFLFTALKRRILNYWRHQAVQREFQVNHTSDTQDNNLARHLELKDLIGNVYARVKGLSPQCQRVFHLKRAERSNKEIAAELNISVKTVEAHYTRAVNFLKKTMAGIAWVTCWFF